MKRLDVEIVTAPRDLLVDFTELKSHLKLSQDLEDAVLTQYVRAAINTVEKHTWQVLQSTSFKGYMTGWGDIRLSQFPVSAVSSVKYYDSSNTLQTMVENTDYYVNLKSDPAQITFENTPSLYDKPNNIEVEFTAGYADRFSVPSDLILDVYFLTGHFYENRGAASTQRVFEVPLGFQFLSGNNNKKMF